MSTGGPNTKLETFPLHPLLCLLSYQTSARHSCINSKYGCQASAIVVSVLARVLVKYCCCGGMRTMSLLPVGTVVSPPSCTLRRAGTRPIAVYLRPDTRVVRVALRSGRATEFQSSPMYMLTLLHHSFTPLPLFTIDSSTKSPPTGPKNNPSTTP